MIRIKCIFGGYERIVEWYDEAGKFPRAFKLNKEYWDQPVMMGSWGDDHDHSVTYHKANFATYVGLELPEFDAMFAHQSSVQKVTGCECGAHLDRHFPNVHSFWCPRWRKV